MLFIVDLEGITLAGKTKNKQTKKQRKQTSPDPTYVTVLSHFSHDPSVGSLEPTYMWIKKKKKRTHRHKDQIGDYQRWRVRGTKWVVVQSLSRL